MNKERHLNAHGKGEFLYDYKYDTVTFKVKDRDYKNSVELQNFVIDIDTKNFVTGIRILDASKITGMSKLILRNLIHGKFKASIKDNVITVRFEFVGKIRNKLVPIFSQRQNFTQQIVTSGNPKHPLENSEVVVPNISIGS